MKPHAWLRRLLPLSAILALAACGGGSGSTSAPIPPAQDGPTALSAKIYQAPATFHLTWTRPTTAFDGYEFEGRSGSAPFAKLHDGLIPNTWNEAYYDGSASLSELETVTFRLRVMRGTTPSAYSNESGARIGLLAPYMNSTWITGGSVSVSWTNNSKVADTLTLERGVTQNGTTTWTTLPGIPFGTTSWMDALPPEGSACSYRVTYSKGQDSAQATSIPLTVPMVAPGRPIATARIEGVGLTWQNSSHVATEVAVMRAAGMDAYPSYQQVALLPAGTTSYEDTLLATGYYTYRLENRCSGIGTTYSAPVQVATLPPQSNGVSVSPTVLSLPQAAAIQRSSQGTWFLSGSYLYNIMVREPQGTSWVDYLPPSAQSWSSPYFLLDSQDRPHLVYTRSVVQGTQEVAIMHAWRDATGWQSEEIARRTLYSSSTPSPYTFALDAQDHLHLLWLKSGGNATDLEYATKDATGAWVAESPVSTSPASYLGSYRLSVDATGQVHAFVGAWQTILHLTRGTGGWVSETVPSNGATVGWYDFLGGVVQGPDSVLVLASRAHQPYDGSYDLLMFRKQAGAWLPEEVVLTTSNYNSFSGALAANKAGTRFALYYGTSGGSMLRVWSAGTWTSALVGPGASYSNPLLGFDAADKLYLLVPAGWGGNTSAFPYVFYQEQP